MKMHSAHKNNEDWVAHKLLDTLMEHTVITLYNAMLFMSDDAQNKLVKQISDQKDKIQGVRLKDKGGRNE